MRHAITLHLLWVLKFRVYSNTPALDLFSKQELGKGGWLVAFSGGPNTNAGYLHSTQHSSQLAI